MNNILTLDLSKLYKSTDTAKLKDIPNYKKKILSKIKGGETIILTGNAPIWLYLIIAHTLHGKVKKLIYNSPVTGDVVVFDHSPT